MIIRVETITRPRYSLYLVDDSNTHQFYLSSDKVSKGDACIEAIDKLERVLVEIREQYHSIPVEER